MKQKTLIVVGGGAAGIFCAVNAARLQPALRVIVLEKTSKLLSKVRISGGGRCNVTHHCFDIVEMSRRYPRGQNFVKKTFHQFFTTDTIRWFEERGVRLKAEADGRMFPVTDSSETIINCLLQEANLYGVDLRMNCAVQSVEKREGRFLLNVSGPHALTADYLLLATGGYPKSSMFEWIQSLGHSIEEPKPSLFTFNMPGNNIVELMGVAVEKARVKVAGTRLSETGPLLITHWGMSGPAVLRLSAWGAYELAKLNYHFSVHINWVPEIPEIEIRDLFRVNRVKHAAKKMTNHPQFNLPSRLWAYLLQQAGVTDDMRWADLPARIENAVIRLLTDYTAEVKGKTTYKEEFVTAGGVILNEVDANTMMSRKMENLFFAGEVLAVDGITGGFNFQHAWTSAFIAAKTIAGR